MIGPWKLLARSVRGDAELPIPSPPRLPPTCYEVVDDGVGALICIHRTSDVAHHSARPRVLGDGERLVLGTVPLVETPGEGRVRSIELALNKSGQIPSCSPPW